MINVLVADDEKWMREDILNSIDWYERGFSIVGEACDGEEAYCIIKRHKPEIVLADIKMPGMDGIELLKKIKRENIRCTFIFFSGYDKFEYAQSAVNLGALGYLLKPVEEGELINMLVKAKEKVFSERQNHIFRPTGTGTVHADEEYYKRLIGEVKEYIAENYINDISLRSVAEEFSFHPNYFCKLFKEETGGNFIEYLTNIRMGKAIELLKDVRYTVIEVAKMTGYNDAKYFSKVFRKVTGLTPIEYIGKKSR